MRRSFSLNVGEVRIFFSCGNMLLRPDDSRRKENWLSMLELLVARRDVYQAQIAADEETLIAGTLKVADGLFLLTQQSAPRDSTPAAAAFWSAALWS